MLKNYEVLVNNEVFISKKDSNLKKMVEKGKVIKLNPNHIEVKIHVLMGHIKEVEEAELW